MYGEVSIDLNLEHCISYFYSLRAIKYIIKFVNIVYTVTCTHIILLILLIVRLSNFLVDLKKLRFSDY